MLHTSETEFQAVMFKAVCNATENGTGGLVLVVLLTQQEDEAFSPRLLLFITLWSIVQITGLLLPLLRR